MTRLCFEQYDPLGFLVAWDCLQLSASDNCLLARKCLRLHLYAVIAETSQDSELAKTWQGDAGADPQD